MQRSLFLLAILLMGMSTPSGAAPKGRFRIESGSKQIPGEYFKRVYATATFRRSVDEVWSSVRRLESIPKFMPLVKESRVLLQEEERGELYIKLDLPWPFPDVWSLLSIDLDPEKRTIAWKQKEGNMKTNRGTLVLTSAGEGKRTDFRLEAQVRPGNFVPQFLVTWGAAHWLPQAITRFGSRLYSEHRRRPPTPVDRSKVKGLKLR